MTPTERLQQHCHHIAELAELCPDNPRWLRRRANRCAQLAFRLHDRLPIVVRAVNLEVSILDGYPATASGADRGGGSGGSSISRPTERAMLARLGGDDEHIGTVAEAHDIVTYIADAARFVRGALDGIRDDDTDDMLRLAETALSKVHRICDKYTPLALAPRCAGTGGTDGASCYQVPDYRLRDDGTVSTSSSGRCTDCQRNHERKQKADSERKRYHEKRSA